MRILVTGGSGFVGRNLVLWLRPRHEVSAPGRKELDLLDSVGVDSFFAHRQFDVVIHAASEGVSRMTPAASTVFGNNCRMFFNLARNGGSMGRLFFLSSGAVYDRAHWRSGLLEEDFGRHVPADDYGFSKYVCAQAARALDQVYELRLFGLFGPHEDWRLRFVSNTCCRALWELPVVIRQNVSFDYIDVEDLCRIIESLLDRDLRYRQYNVCRGSALPLLTLARKIGFIAGRNLEIQVKTEGSLEYSGDNGRLLRELPGLCFQQLDDSLARLYAWYATRKEMVAPALLQSDKVTDSRLGNEVQG